MREVGGVIAPVFQGYIVTLILPLLSVPAMFCQLLIAPYIGLGIWGAVLLDDLFDLLRAPTPDRE